MTRELKDLPEVSIYLEPKDDYPYLEEEVMYAESDDAQVGFRQLGQVSEACAKIDPLDGRGARWFDVFPMVDFNLHEICCEVAHDERNIVGDIGLTCQEVSIIVGPGHPIMIHASPLQIYVAKVEDRIGYYQYGRGQIAACALIYYPNMGDRWFYVFDMPVPNAPELQEIIAKSPSEGEWFNHVEKLSIAALREKKKK